MIEKRVKILDTIALAEDLPKYGLKRGDVGTIVEKWAPGVYEVEFSKENGEPYAMVDLRPEQILIDSYVA